MQGLYAVKPHFQRSLGGVADWLAARHVHPDQLTLAAFSLSMLGGAAILAAPRLPALLLLVPVVALGRTALNALDGMVARRLGLTRAWGEVLNELCDRLADVMLLGSVALLPGLPTWLGTSMLVAVLLASYAGILGKAAGGRRQYGGIMGKADRMFLLGLTAPAALAFGLDRAFSLFCAVVLTGALVTLVQRLWTIHGEQVGT